MGETEPYDFLTLLQRAQLSDEDIAQQSTQFMLAGYETTATTIAAAIGFLAAHPTVQTKFQQELHNAVWTQLQTRLSTNPLLNMSIWTVFSRKPYASFQQLPKWSVAVTTKPNWPVSMQPSPPEWRWHCLFTRFTVTLNTGAAKKQMCLHRNGGQTFLPPRRPPIYPLGRARENVLVCGLLRMKLSSL